MAFRKRNFNNQKAAENTGFGSNAANYGGRLLNKDGRPNIRKIGLGPLERFSWFHSMLAISRTRFFLIVLVFYVAVNILFTLIYYAIGVQHLIGLDVHTEGAKFMEAFFFSAQTFTTVGYGRISPDGFLTNAVAAFQALIGLLSFAVATGLMYGRFSRPKAYLKFADNALIAPFKEAAGLMVRLTPFKNTMLTQAEASITLFITENENEKAVNKFFPLELQLPAINTLTLSWTLVHPITEESPLYGFTEEDFKSTRGELIVFIKAFDDMFSNTVISRTSYTLEEVVYGAKFIPMYYRDNDTTILDLEKLSSFEKADLPELSKV
jgi:inward rectifier potassium channel